VATSLDGEKLRRLQTAITFADLARQIGIRPQLLGFIIHRTPLDRQYIEFTIPKKSGGHRKIAAPVKNLKILQRNLYSLLSGFRDFKPIVTAFILGRGIHKNAEIHLGQRHILNIDLEDFFGSINFGRIYAIRPPYAISKPVAAAIAKACTLNNTLPQGAPTSPVLSNLVSAKLDSDLSKLARKHHCKYSRYADDITLSTHRHTSLSQASLLEQREAAK
jgi:RNA-directed DNA polymerase